MAFENPKNWPVLKVSTSDSLGNSLIGQQLSASSASVVPASDSSWLVTGNVTAQGSFQPVPGTTGGLTISRTLVANNTTGILISTGAHLLYNLSAFGNGSTIAYVKLYNKATAPTVGTDTPVWEGLIPQPAAGGGGFVMDWPLGLTFSLGIGLGVTTSILDSDTAGIPAANTYIVNMGYK